MATNLSGFWKDSNSPSEAHRKLSEFKNKYSVKAKNQKPPKKKKVKTKKVFKASPSNDRFYLCIPWRELRYLALKNCDGRCMCCGASAKDGVRIHVDHILPRSRYPSLELDINNIQVLCEDCNIGKGAWDETDWRPIID